MGFLPLESLQAYIPSGGHAVDSDILVRDSVEHVDTPDPAERSERMSGRHRDQAGMGGAASSLGLGFRYRLHGQELRAVQISFSPDPERRFSSTVAFGISTKVRADAEIEARFLASQASRQPEEDLRNQRALRSSEWEYMVIWECG